MDQQIETLKTNWYKGWDGKVRMATLQKVQENGKTYYTVNGDKVNPIYHFEAANSAFLSY